MLKGTKLHLFFGGTRTKAHTGINKSCWDRVQFRGELDVNVSEISLHKLVVAIRLLVSETLFPVSDSYWTRKWPRIFFLTRLFRLKLFKMWRFRSRVWYWYFADFKTPKLWLNSGPQWPIFFKLRWIESLAQAARVKIESCVFIRTKKRHQVTPLAVHKSRVHRILASRYHFPVSVCLTRDFVITWRTVTWIYVKCLRWGRRKSAIVAKR